MYSKLKTSLLLLLSATLFLTHCDDDGTVDDPALGINCTENQTLRSVIETEDEYSDLARIMDYIEANESGIINSTNSVFFYDLDDASASQTIFAPTNTGLAENTYPTFGNAADVEEFLTNFETVAENTGIAQNGFNAADQLMLTLMIHVTGQNFAGVDLGDGDVLTNSYYLSTGADTELDILVDSDDIISVMSNATQLNNNVEVVGADVCADEGVSNGSMHGIDGVLFNESLETQVTQGLDDL